jgi:hypothetical protein
MNKLHDPELELCKRTVDLADYAMRAGYEPRPQDGAPGLTVLDHPNRDRIVVGRHPDGPWIYASVPDYALRPPGEPAAHALSRLRHCIDRATDKGTIVEFVQQRDPWARRGEVPLDQVRDRLRTFRATGLALDFDGALSPPPYPRTRERDVERDPDPLPSGGSVGPKPDLHRRRYDWTPPVDSRALETEEERALRQRRETQAAIERRERAAREVQPPAPLASKPAPLAKDPGRPTPDRPPTERGATIANRGKSELGRRRYDWTPTPTDIDAIVRGPRGPSGGRDR